MNDEGPGSDPPDGANSPRSADCGFSTRRSRRSHGKASRTPRSKTSPRRLASSRGLIYHDFRSKEELLFAVVELAGYLEHRIAVGELRPHDPRVTALTLFFTIVLLRLTRTGDDGFLPALVHLLLPGIVAR